MIALTGSQRRGRNEMTSAARRSRGPYRRRRTRTPTLGPSATGNQGDPAQRHVDGREVTRRPGTQRQPLGNHQSKGGGGHEPHAASRGIPARECPRRSGRNRRRRRSSPRRRSTSRSVGGLLLEGEHWPTASVVSERGQVRARRSWCPDVEHFGSDRLVRRPRGVDALGDDDVLRGRLDPHGPQLLKAHAALRVAGEQQVVTVLGR